MFWKNSNGGSCPYRTSNPETFVAQSLTAAYSVHTAIDPWPPYRISGFPTAEHFETSAMPSQDGLRLNHLVRTKKARPEPRHPGEQGAVTFAQSTTRRRPPQCDVELMTEKQILSFKPAPRLE
jgi:hypothetical protein